MEIMSILKNTLLGLFFGTFGTTLGGIIGLRFDNTSNKTLSSILSFASGLMMSIVCFDLIPEALDIADFGTVVTSVGIGIIAMIMCDIVVQNRMTYKSNSLLKTGIACGIGLALHNFPEGLAIGSGFEASMKLRLFSCNNYRNSRCAGGSFDVCSNEKWWNEVIKSHNISDIIGYNNRNRCFFW